MTVLEVLGLLALGYFLGVAAMIVWQLARIATALAAILSSRPVPAVTDLRDRRP